MAQFLGKVRGGRGPATRLGHKWIETIAASKSGAIRTSLKLESSGKISFIVEQIPWQGNGQVGTLAQGVLSDD